MYGGEINITFFRQLFFFLCLFIVILHHRTFIKDAQPMHRDIYFSSLAPQRFLFPSRSFLFPCTTLSKFVYGMISEENDTRHRAPVQATLSNGKAIDANRLPRAIYLRWHNSRIYRLYPRQRCSPIPECYACLLCLYIYVYAFRFVCTCALLCKCMVCAHVYFGMEHYELLHTQMYRLHVHTLIDRFLDVSPINTGSISFSASLHYWRPLSYKLERNIKA